VFGAEDGEWMLCRQEAGGEQGIEGPYSVVRSSVGYGASPGVTI